MKDDVIEQVPETFPGILADTLAAGFTMASDIKTCSLLRTLAASKRRANLLELGTGTGLSTAWILSGMDSASTLISIDNDKVFLSLAEKNLLPNNRLTLVLSDGAAWVQKNLHQQFDFIFADTWHGKYLLLDEVLNMFVPGGFYIIDDMLPQPNWPEGHAEKATNLLSILDSRPDLFLTRQNWASGIIVAVKK